MKKIIFYLFVLAGLYSNAQNIIISDDSTYSGTSANALFEIYSSNRDKGILIPRLTTSQRTSISTTGADEGLVVYDTDTHSFWVWSDNQWKELGDKQQLSISGHNLSIDNGNTVTLPDNDNQTLLFNSSTNTLSISGGNSVDLSSLAGGGSSDDAWKLTGNSGTSSSNFIGTTDNVPLTFKINNTQSGKISQDNTSFGYNSHHSLTSGQYNCILGDNAGYYLTDADEDVFIGHGSGYYMQNGSSNVGIGYNALYCYGASGGGPRPGGNGNIAIGKWAMFNPYEGDYNVAVGFSAFSLPNSGSYNVFIGYHADRDGNSSLNYATAIGSYARADADNATAIGYRAYANQPNTVILGSINGVNSATASVKVGIGTTNPTATLEVKTPNLSANEASVKITPLGHAGSSTSEFSLIDFWSTFDNYSTDQAPRRTASIKAHFIGGTWGYEALSICVGNAGDAANEPTERVRIVDDNQGSNMVAGGSWASLSDKRLKTNEQDLPYGLNEILSLKPVKYVIHDPKNFNDIPQGVPSGKGRVEIGFIAQDIYKVIPEVVNKPEDDSKQLWTMKYERLTPVLVKAIQEQQKEIDELKTRNETLEKENAEMRKMLEDFGKRLRKLENR